MRLPLVMRNHVPQPALVINEIMYWPAGGDAGNEWIEVYNPTPYAINLGGWTISNGDLSSTATLPAWTMPANTYLVVHFGVGANDDDFSDGAGEYYTRIIAEVFDNQQDGAALYQGSPSAGTIVDFVAWSALETYSGGTAHDHAVEAGVWTAGAFFDAVDALSPPYLKRAIVFPGDSIGRDKDSADTDEPEDWEAHGGRDAIAPTPGARNLHDLPFSPLQPCRKPQLPKAWTFMVYLNADNNLEPYGFRDINEMEMVGSDTQRPERGCRGCHCRTPRSRASQRTRTLDLLSNPPVDTPVVI